LKPCDYGVPEVASNSVAELLFAPPSKAQVNADRVLLRGGWFGRADSAEQVVPHLGQFDADQLMLPVQPFGTQPEVPVPEVGIDITQVVSRRSWRLREVLAG
jgi:hypothetical protein